MSDHSQANSLSQSVFVNSSHANTASNSDETKELALTMVAAGEDRKAGDIVMLHVAEVSYRVQFSQLKQSLLAVLKRNAQLRCRVYGFAIFSLNLNRTHGDLA